MIGRVRTGSERLGFGKLKPKARRTLKSHLCLVTDTDHTVNDVAKRRVAAERLVNDVIHNLEALNYETMP